MIHQSCPSLTNQLLICWAPTVRFILVPFHFTSISMKRLDSNISLNRPYPCGDILVLPRNLHPRRLL